MPRYIDADSLYERLEGYFQMIEDYSNLDIQPWYIIGLRKVIDALKNEPTADVQEVKHAKWLPYRFGLEVVACSNCRAVYEGGDSFRFCPKCGAKMDLEDK